MTANQNKALRKYLSHYAEPELERATNSLLPAIKQHGHHFNHALCVPAYAEELRHLSRLANFLSQQSNTLLIVVLNQPDTLAADTYEEKKQLNASWVSWLKDKDKKLEGFYSEQPFYYFPRGNQNAILVVDRFSQNPIPYKQGVGLARKIGADLALLFYANEMLTSGWLHNADADVSLNKDYFLATERITPDKYSAVIYPFKHVDHLGEAVKPDSADPVTRATAIYEQRLHQYTNGLMQAKSPYAFHTIGSCIAVSLRYYAECRGFPKYSAGEDFYLLNKLRKTAEIKSLASPNVLIESRSSIRTPFGTGAAVRNLLDDSSGDRERIFYPPTLFKELGVFIRWQSDWALNREENNLKDWRENLAKYAGDHSAHVHVQTAESINLEQGLEHCEQQTKTYEAFVYQMQCWFDGFKTLKWLHAYRDIADIKMLDFAEFCDIGEFCESNA